MNPIEQDELVLVVLQTRYSEDSSSDRTSGLNIINNLWEQDCGLLAGIRDSEANNPMGGSVEDRGRGYREMWTPLKLEGETGTMDWT